MGYDQFTLKQREYAINKIKDFFVRSGCQVLHEDEDHII